MNRTLWWAVACCLLTACCYAQDEDPSEDQPQQEELPGISPDRPGWGDCSNTLPRKTLQLEAGFYYDRINYATLREHNYNYISGLLRWGVTDNFELRFGLGGGQRRRVVRKAGDVEIDEDGGFLPLQFGTKIQILRPKKHRPEIAFLGMVTLPWVGAKNFKPQNIAPMVRFCFTNELNERFAINYNLGMDWDGGSEVNWFATLGLDMQVVGDLGAFVEGVTWIDQSFDGAEVGINGGLVYVIEDIVQLDVSGGYTYAQDAPWWFLMAGISWRFPR